VVVDALPWLGVGVHQGRRQQGQGDTHSTRIPSALPSSAWSTWSAGSCECGRSACATWDTAPARPGMLVPFMAVVMRGVVMGAVARGVRMRVAHASRECQLKRVAAHR
jgi:hypothetical protein